MPFEVVSDSPGRTALLGEIIGKRLQGGTLILLEGELGAGKTVFAKGLGGGLDISEEITSPSFNLMLRYEGRLGFDHWDLYRLDIMGEDEEFLESVYDNRSITVVEWGERLKEKPDVPTLAIKLELTDIKQERKIIFDGDAELLSEVVTPIINEWKDK